MAVVIDQNESLSHARASGAARIDPRAEISPRARIGAGCVVGPFAVIGDSVTLGPGCVIHAHGVVTGPTTLGERNEVFPFACIGGAPQDRRHRGEPTRLVVGSSNVFREHVTVSRGTLHGGSLTTVGDGNLLMAYCHVAHDCHLGSNITMANHATLAGHVIVEDHAVFGGLVGIGAFLRIGESAMVAAGSMVERDVPPFCTVHGDRARLRGVNRVGLERRGLAQSARGEIKEIFKALKSLGTTLEEVAERFEGRELSAPARRMIDFLKASDRGLAR